MWNLLHDIEKSEDLSLSNTSSVGVQGGLGAPIYWRKGASVRQYIGAGGPRSANILAQGASVRQYIGAPMSPSANRQWWPGTVRQKIFFCVRSATPIGAGWIGAPIVLAYYK